MPKLKNTLLPYQNENIIEIGIDEAGRGTLIGPVYIAGVILPKNILELCNEHNIILKDSKKLSKKRRFEAELFIKQYALAYSIIEKNNDLIDEKNILACTLEGMHDVVDDISLKLKPNKILVDGDKFKFYRDFEGNLIEHECIISGDNTYMSIAAASILAKTAKDRFIIELVEKYPDLNKYDLLNNSGYGTKKHLEAINQYGITNYHRKTFGICKKFT
jgi:ribonuclease HII